MLPLPLPPSCLTLFLLWLLLLSTSPFFCTIPRRYNPYHPLASFLQLVNCNILTGRGGGALPQQNWLHLLFLDLLYYPAVTAQHGSDLGIVFSPGHLLLAQLVFATE
jgi:hypothetical protein